MILCFELSMPSNNAWDGKWSGEKSRYAVIRNRGKSQKAAQHGRKLIENSPYYYRFDDGWTAGVTVSEVDAAGARKARRESRGFCGYDWMIESIVMDGAIMTRSQRLQLRALEGAES